MPSTTDEIIERLRSPKPPEPTLDQNGNPVQRITIDCESLTAEQVDVIASAIVNNTWLQRIQLVNCSKDYIYEKFSQAIFQHNANPKQAIKIERLIFAQSIIDIASMRKLLPLLAADHNLKLVVLPRLMPHVANILFEHKIATQSIVFTETDISGYSAPGLGKFIKGNPQLKELYLKLDLDVSAEPEPHFDNATIRDTIKKFFVALHSHPGLHKVQVTFVPPDQKEQLMALMSLVPEISEECNALLQNHTAFQFNVEYSSEGDPIFYISRDNTAPSKRMREIINPEKIANFDEFLDVQIKILYDKLEEYILSLEQFEDDEPGAHQLYASLLNPDDQKKIKTVLREMLKEHQTTAHFIAVINKLEGLALDCGVFSALYRDLTNKPNFNFREFQKQFTSAVFVNKVPHKIQTGSRKI